ncbi:MAG: hypothetical protein NTW59_03180 [Candidatus Diapherotrites archaeon]|nr:hypothetical protein [Candidatus Diapherotrites archaeon]
MNRGFVFSMDAALALVAVIIVLGTAAQQYSPADESGGVSEQLQQKAYDRAVTGNYARNLASTPGVTETIGQNADFGECTVLYTLNPNSPGGQSAVQKNTFCEEPT